MFARRLRRIRRKINNDDMLLCAGIYRDLNILDDILCRQSLAGKGERQG